MSLSSELTLLRKEADTIANRACELAKLLRTAEHDAPSTSTPSSLHLAHYTSLEALVSMLHSPDDGLRLSDSSAMSDPEEGRATSDARFLYRQLKEEFDSDSWISQRYSSAYLGCFVGVERSAEQKLDAGDDLLFWRLYGNEGRGVSITLPPHLSERLVESSMVQRVIYTDEPDMNPGIGAVSKLLKDLERLRAQAMEAGVWDGVCKTVIPKCDFLLGQRFLLKRSHYKMEKEYRAVAFDTEEGDGTCLEGESQKGWRVQLGQIRRFVQYKDFSCRAILTTQSQITVGNNVPQAKCAADIIKKMLEDRQQIPGVVAVRVSERVYRPR